MLLRKFSDNWTLRVCNVFKLQMSVISVLHKLEAKYKVSLQTVIVKAPMYQHLCCVLVFGRREAKETFISHRSLLYIVCSIIVVSWSLKHFLFSLLEMISTPPTVGTFCKSWAFPKIQIQLVICGQWWGVCAQGVGTRSNGGHPVQWTPLRRHTRTYINA